MAPPDAYTYVGGGGQCLDPYGSLTVRAYVSRAGGNGNEWRYVSQFNPFSLKDVPGLGGRKGLNKRESIIDAM